MRYCEFCGAPLDDDALFCTNCGARLSSFQPAPSPATDIPVQANSVPNIVPVIENNEEFEDKKNNKIIRIILLSFLTVVLAAGIVIAFLITGNSNKNESRDNDTEKVLHKMYKLHGSISNYPIFMKLIIEGNLATGSYYYESQGPDKVLDLKGIYDNNILELFETDENGQQTGHFKGHLEERHFIGTFFDARGNSMNFRLEE